MPKTNILARTFGLKAPTPDAIHRKIDKGERRVEEANKALEDAALANLENEGSGDVAAAIRNLTAAKEHVATLRAALALSERLEAKEAAAKAAEARRKRNEATLKAFDDLIAKAEAIAPLAVQWTGAYAELVKATNTARDAILANGDVRRDLVTAFVSPFEQAANALSRLHVEGAPIAPGVNVLRISQGHLDKLKPIGEFYTDLRAAVASDLGQ